MQEKTIKIICAIHKEFALPPLPYLFPVHTGAQLSTLRLPYAKDNEGTNISHKNALYNEITALYWVWKNEILKDTTYIGLCHYRRYFMARRPLFSKRGVHYFSSAEEVVPTARNLPAVTEELLQQYDLIISKPSKTLIEKTRVSIAHSYAHLHDDEDWQQMREVIYAYQPHYFTSFEAWSKGSRFNQLNMFISRRSFLDEYMPWLISILEPLESRIKQHQHPYQQRVIGFLSERLLSLYIYHHQFKTYWLPVAVIH